MPFLVALERSILADWVGGPIYPVISALHILAFAFVIVPVLMADVRVLTVGAADETVIRLARIAVFGFGCAALTGILLFSVQATRYAENPAIYWKFGFLCAAGLNALCFRWFVNLRQSIAFVSAIFWCGVLFSGRWIAFAG
ncbi:MAG: hypothetical protein NXH88_11030 [Hyphomonas sp.]|nr:hypothetical protein [Hyphomonas sp.]